jgi:PEGA domain-containing protein
MNRILILIVLLWAAPLLLFARKDPANYPLKVHILQQPWASHNLRHGEHRGTGRGNIWEGDSIHAFEFTYECGFPLQKTARNQPYMGKWNKPQLRLAILAPKIGKNDSYQECVMKTTVHPGVYVLGGGGITEMSQEEFKGWRAQRDAARTQPGNSGVPASALISVASIPDGAEIEVDGEFMGNTPSVFELDPGEHQITIAKAGYKAWEKKLKLTAGEVKLKAELEPDSK